MLGNDVKVTIGVPVYNGENFLAKSLDSLLGQTYERFELIISDNASTDGTEAISRDYARKDSRVKYVRNENNLGAASNYNRLVDMAQGEYFKWAAHDDTCAPTFLERSVEILDSHPEVVLCFSQAHGIDEEDRYTFAYDNDIRADMPESWKRFYETACRRHNMVAIMAFGLMRTNVLRRTHKIGAFASSDRVLIPEMALHGRFSMVPEVLLFKRDHPHTHWMQYRTRQERIAWYDTSVEAERTYPHWRLLQEHIVSIKKAPLSVTERMRCYGMLAPWIRYNWRKMLRNLAQRDSRASPVAAAKYDVGPRQAAP